MVQCQHGVSCGLSRLVHWNLTCQGCQVSVIVLKLEYLDRRDQEGGGVKVTQMTPQFACIRHKIVDYCQYQPFIKCPRGNIHMQLCHYCYCCLNKSSVFLIVIWQYHTERVALCWLFPRCYMWAQPWLNMGLMICWTLLRFQFHHWFLL